jgi:hypothetical protein
MIFGKDKIFKTKLQASAASGAKTLPSQNRQRTKIRHSLNGLQVVHGRLTSRVLAAEVIQAFWHQ